MESKLVITSEHMISLELTNQNSPVATTAQISLVSGAHGFSLPVEGEEEELVPCQ